jgi:hypothetical protein
MSTEAEQLHRIISASVRDMLDAYRIQAQAGPVTDHLPSSAWHPPEPHAVSGRAAGGDVAECCADVIDGLH